MTTSLIVQQSHCGKHGICKAGPMLRLIDELSGSLAVGVIKGFCVTGSLDNITFISPVPCGNYIFCCSFIIIVVNIKLKKKKFSYSNKY